MRAPPGQALSATTGWSGVLSHVRRFWHACPWHCRVHMFTDESLHRWALYRVAPSAEMAPPLDPYTSQYDSWMKPPLGGNSSSCLLCVLVLRAGVRVHYGHAMTAVRTIVVKVNRES